MAYPLQRKTETCEINGVEYKTHFWYMDCAKDLTGMERHRMYYGQFISPAVKRYISNAFTKAQWATMAAGLKAGDEHLNDSMPLRYWDRLDSKQLVGRLITECTYEDAPQGVMYWSPSQNTCICKEAARQLLESGEYPQ